GLASARIEAALLGEEDEGELGGTSRPCLSFRARELVESAAEVHRPGAGDLGCAPRDRRRQRPVELEGPGPAPVAQQGALVPLREPAPGDAEELARRHVGQDEIGGRQLVHRRRGAYLAAEAAQPLDQRVREPTCAAAWERPADGVAHRQEREADGCTRAAL